MLFSFLTARNSIPAAVLVTIWALITGMSLAWWIFWIVVGYVVTNVLVIGFGIIREVFGSFRRSSREKNSPPKN